MFNSLYNLKPNIENKLIYKSSLETDNINHNKSTKAELTVFFHLADRRTQLTCLVKLHIAKTTNLIVQEKVHQEYITKFG